MPMDPVTLLNPVTFGLGLILLALLALFSARRIQSNFPGMAEGATRLMMGLALMLLLAGTGWIGWYFFAIPGIESQQVRVLKEIKHRPFNFLVEVQVEDETQPGGKSKECERLTSGYCLSWIPNALDPKHPTAEFASPTQAGKMDSQNAPEVKCWNTGKGPMTDAGKSEPLVQDRPEDMVIASLMISYTPWSGACLMKGVLRYIGNSKKQNHPIGDLFESQYRCGFSRICR